MNAGPVPCGSQLPALGAGQAASADSGPLTAGGLATAVADLLDGEPLLAEASSRRLLAQLTGDVLGGPLQVPESPYPRQWLLGFAAECARHAGGLAALSLALARLDGGGRVSTTVRALLVSAPVPGGVPGWPACTGAQPAAAPFAARPAAGSQLRLTPAEVAEFAVIYAEPTRARQLLAAAGLSPARHPYFAVDSRTFWQAVSDLIASGGLPDGRARLLAAAAADYPSNVVFTGAPGDDPPPSQPPPDIPGTRRGTSGRRPGRDDTQRDSNSVQNVGRIT